MDKKKALRLGAMSAVIVLLFGTIVFRLQDLQIRNGEAYAAQSQKTQYRTLTLKGARGKILDANGIALAYDQKSYDVQFYRDTSKNSEADRRNYTEIIRQTIALVEQYGGSTIDTFPIRLNDQEEFEFQWGEITSEQAARREELWRNNLNYNAKNEDGSYKQTPKDIYYDFRDRYFIGDDVSYEESLKILSVWNEVRLSAYIAYLPVTIAKDVGFDTVAAIESRSLELSGMNIAESTVRIYPQGSTASQVLGYTGRMVSQEQIEEYEAQGYSQDDWIGISGIESSMEQYLTGCSTQRQGSQQVEVNNVGKIIRQISYDAPESGDNVMLTLDLSLQRITEAALARNIEEAQARQEERYNDPDLHDNYVQMEEARGSKYKKANSGTAVVLDVKTGNVLAMANAPGYDNMLFSGGISTEDYQQLAQNEAAPLMNKAIASMGTPGSIFKMVTGLAGLMEGEITLTEEISDEGPYNKHVVSGKGPSCWVTPNFASHANETYTTALRDSCNYYFFETSDRLGIDNLHRWAQMFGLVDRTNIELPGEKQGNVADQKVLFDPDKPIDEQNISMPVLVHKRICEVIAAGGEAGGVLLSQETVEDAAYRIMQQSVSLKDNELGPMIRTILQDELKIPRATVRQRDMVIDISGRLSEVRWNANSTIVAGIGQSVTTITPIAVARYVAALVNGGTVYEAHIVDKVLDASGEVVYQNEPKVFQDLGIPEEYLEATRVGMKEVVNPEDGGTAANYFKDFKYLDRIGGKTGTAQVSNMDLENNAWFVCFAPYEDPEIAVVVFIPNGYSGGIASLTAKDVVQYYLDKRDAVVADDIPMPNSLQP